jgi:alpha-galactosidase
VGYSTWYDVGCGNISERYIISIADRLLSTNLSKLGYEYINIDDCWQVGRDDNGVLLPDPIGFPNGIKPVAQQVHKRGLKLGLYTDRGTHTCQKRPGSWLHEKLDANTFAAWEIDFLKEDSCYAVSTIHSYAFFQYSVMRDALNATGRQIVFSICGWNRWYATQGPELGNIWRIASDNVNWNSVYAAARQMEQVTKYAGPGGWNDPDFVLGSNSDSHVHLTPLQSRTQFSLWCIMAAPLILSGPDALKPDTHDYETFSNAKAIAVNQDPSGIPGKVVISTCPKFRLPSWTGLIDRPPSGCTQIWYKPLSFRSNAIALVFVNWDPKQPLSIACDSRCMRRIGIPNDAAISSIEDVWASSDSESGETLSSKNIVYNLEGPGRIQATLDGAGGSAFLIVEWATSEMMRAEVS